MNKWEIEVMVWMLIILIAGLIIVVVTRPTPAIEPETVAIVDTVDMVEYDKAIIRLQHQIDTLVLRVDEHEQGLQESRDGLDWLRGIGYQAAKIGRD
jgi:hypothetical protein